MFVVLNGKQPGVTGCQIWRIKCAFRCRLLLTLCGARVKEILFCMESKEKPTKQRSDKQKTPYLVDLHNNVAD
jgi:hypothetical protein